MDMKGYIAKVLFKSGEASLGEKNDKGEDEFSYLIAEFCVQEETVKGKKVVYGRSEEKKVVVKGSLPFSAGYFEYCLKCVEKWDSGRNSYAYFIVSMSGVKLAFEGINLWTAKWIACVENGASLKSFSFAWKASTGVEAPPRADIPRPNAFSAGKWKTAPLEKYSKIYPKSDYGRWKERTFGTIIEAFPKDAAKVLASDESSKRTKTLLEKASSDPLFSWSLAFRKSRESSCACLKNKPSVELIPIILDGEYYGCWKEDANRDLPALNLSSSVWVPGRRSDHVKGRCDNATKAKPVALSLKIDLNHYKMMALYSKIKGKLKVDKSSSFVLSSTVVSWDRLKEFDEITEREKGLAIRAKKAHHFHWGEEGFGSFDEMRSMVKEILCEKMGALRFGFGLGNFAEVYSLSKEDDIHAGIVTFYERLVREAGAESFAKDRLFEKKDYVESEHLSEEQKSAVEKVRTTAIVNIIALPGRGKTRTIKELYSRFSCAVVTSVASLASNLRKDVSSRTICSAIAIGESRRNLIEGQRDLWKEAGYETVEVLVVDEAEDVPTIHMAKLYECFESFSKLKRIVHVFDPKQIGPIGKGTLALDLQNSMRGTACNVFLRRAFRFEKPSGSQSNVAKNDELLLKGKFSDMKYATVDLKKELERKKRICAKGGEKGEFLLPEEDLVFLSPVGSEPTNSEESLKLNVSLFDSLVPSAFGISPEERRRSKDVSPLMCLTLTNRFKNVLNRYVEDSLNPLKNAFYPGQRITVVDDNFKEKSFFEEPKERKRSHRGEKRPDCDLRGRKGGKESKGEDERPLSSSGAENGSFYVIKSIEDYDVSSKKWVGCPLESNGGLSEKNAFSYDFENLRRCLLTFCGKVLCIHPNYVPRKNLTPGWAATVDKAKGLDYDNVLFAFSEKYDKMFSPNHLHVALTRSKGKTYVMSDFDTFRRYATFVSTVMPDKTEKYDLMEEKMKDMVKRSTSRIFEGSPLKSTSEDEREKKGARNEENSKDESTSPGKKRTVSEAKLDVCSYNIA